jgi:5-methylcytosine-specific restriction endonuclease McrA
MLSCGNEKILALGLCATCYTLKRQDAEYFGGLREQVLERDGYACRVCGDPDPGVHHREPGKSVLHLMMLSVRDVTRRSTGRRSFLPSFRRSCWSCGESSTPKATNRGTLISTSANQRPETCH